MTPGDVDIDIEIVRDSASELKNKVLQRKREDAEAEEPAKAGQPSTKRDKFAISELNEQEASERYQASVRDGDVKVEDLEDDGLCFICYTNPPNAVFLDCGHGGTPRSPGMCLDCSIDSMKRNNACTMCRKEVIQILEIESLNNIDGLFKVLNSYYVSTINRNKQQV